MLDENTVECNELSPQNMLAPPPPFGGEPTLGESFVTSSLSAGLQAIHWHSGQS